MCCEEKEISTDNVKLNKEDEKNDDEMVEKNNTAGAKTAYDDNKKDTFVAKEK